MAIAPWWAVRIRRPLRKTDFTPPPAVDTVLLELKPHETPLLDRSQQVAYTDFVMECYAAPRFYARVGGVKEKRPSTLTVDEWLRLFARFSSRKK
jgi:23S rRNA (adenine-N6)-dimethyltransferase